jgi:hypothetical protein
MIMNNEAGCVDRKWFGVLVLRTVVSLLVSNN